MSRMPRKAAVAAVIAVGLVLVVAAVAVVAAVDGVFGHHVALRPIAHPFPAGVLAAVVLHVALRGLVRREHPRRLAQLGAGALGLLLAFGAGLSYTAAWHE